MSHSYIDYTFSSLNMFTAWVFPSGIGQWIENSWQRCLIRNLLGCSFRTPVDWPEPPRQVCPSSWRHHQWTHWTEHHTLAYDQFFHKVSTVVISTTEQQTATTEHSICHLWLFCHIYDKYICRIYGSPLNHLLRRHEMYIIFCRPMGF